MGGSARGCKQEQRVLFCVPVHPTGASAEQFFGSSTTRKPGCVMAFDWLGCVGQECAWFDSMEDSGKDGGILS